MNTVISIIHVILLEPVKVIVTSTSRRQLLSDVTFINYSGTIFTVILNALIQKTSDITLATRIKRKADEKK